jgi:1,4-alpha-glucan branching enzyme
MGCEFGQGEEWNFNQALSWYVLDYPLHQGLKKLTGDLNRLYRNYPALHHFDFEPQGFEWIDCHDSRHSVISYIRKDEETLLVVALNFTPLPREGYRIGVPNAGNYRELFNSDSTFYGGSDIGNAGMLSSEDLSWMGRPHSLTLTLPPLAAVVLEWTPE